MGDEISAIRYSAEERQRYREKVDLCLDVFERLLATWPFDDDRPMTGLEMELNLVGPDFRPTLSNAAVLEASATRTSRPSWALQHRTQRRALAAERPGRHRDPAA